MKFGYNTNGFAHHTPADALALLADLGYTAVGITLDHGWLNPYAPDFTAQLRQWRKWLTRYRFDCVIETGARFLLDPRHKHEPTLVSADAAERALRVAFYERALACAVELEATAVSLWSGIAHGGANEESVWDRLEHGLTAVLAASERRGVPLGFEPEPGMFIDTLDRYAELRRRVNHPLLKLTLDIGHLHCLGETPIAEKIAEFSGELINVHLEDMRHGTHEHLQFGEGEIDFPPILAALRESGYSHGSYVELSRHSHCAPTAAATAIQRLRAWE